MKIFIDINHPAHVHYFRNFIEIMKDKGHEFIVTNRDSKMINYLLDCYKIPHIIRNKRISKLGMISTAWNLWNIIKKIFIVSLKQKPDLYLGFANAPSAIIAKIRNKPCILLDDTEHNVLNHRLYLPGASIVLTPFYFTKNLGKKQFVFNAFVEQLYLHSNVYKENNDVLNQCNLKKGKYSLVRYIAYDAHHDKNVHPVSISEKIKFLNIVAQSNNIVLSTEEGANDLYPEKYKMKFAPEYIHDIEYGARYMLTEGGTMATECFLLGVPYILINPLHAGASDYQTSVYNEMAFQSTDSNAILERISYYENHLIDKESHRKNIEEHTIDPTKFLVWLVENYPVSEKQIRQNPEIQNLFK